MAVSRRFYVACPDCRRNDLPVVPGLTPARWGTHVAHVDVNGNPCGGMPISFVETWSDMVWENDELWDL